MSVFGDNYERYIDADLSVIPLIGKRPAVEWKEFQTRKPTFKECEAWETELGDKITGIGVILGRVSNLTGLDIDVPEYAAELPKGIVEREGQPGRVVRFFQYNGEKTTHLANGKISILSDGSYVALPESLHPVTNSPYKWTVNALPFEDLTLLSPKAVMTFVASLRLEKSTSTHGPVDLTQPGRNNKLVELSYAMACKGHTVKEISDALLASEWASWFSDPTEPHRGKEPRVSAKIMAKRAVESSEKKGERQNLQEFELPGFDSPVPTVSLEPAKNVSRETPRSDGVRTSLEKAVEVEIVEPFAEAVRRDLLSEIRAHASPIDQELKAEILDVAAAAMVDEAAANTAPSGIVDTTFMLADEIDAMAAAAVRLAEEFPTPPPGILRDTMELISKRNYNSDVPGCGLAGALSIFATLASNRVKWESTWPVLICVGVADSGTGKQTAQDIALEVLSPVKLKGQLYKSGASMIAGLDVQRERLDIIDEFDDMLNKIKNGGVFQTEIMSFLTNAWTASKGLFSTASTAATRKEAKASDFYNPCINILGFGTVDRVIAASSEAMAHQGFYPRMLVFRDEIGKEWRPEMPKADQKPLIEKLKALALTIVEGMPIQTKPQVLTDIHGNDVSDQAMLNARDEIRVPRDLVLDSEATLDWWVDYKKWAHKEGLKLKEGRTNALAKEHPMTMFARRRAEHVARIAIVACFAEWAYHCAGEDMMPPRGFKDHVPLRVFGAPTKIIETRFGSYADDDREGKIPWTIRLDHLEWAAKVVEYCYFNEAELLGAIMRNDQMNSFDRRAAFIEDGVEKILNETGFIWRRDLTRRFSSAQRKELDSVLLHLAEGGRITMTKVLGGRGPVRQLIVRTGRENEAVAGLGLVKGTAGWTIP